MRKLKTVHENAPSQLAKKDKRLTARLLHGWKPDFFNQHAWILDDNFRQVFESSMVGRHMDISKNPYAISAQGGYGREEQCIYANVNLLFLFRKKVPAAANGLIQKIACPLWDIGLDIGYPKKKRDRQIILYIFCFLYYQI